MTGWNLSFAKSMLLCSITGNVICGFSVGAVMFGQGVIIPKLHFAADASSTT